MLLLARLARGASFRTRGVGLGVHARDWSTFGRLCELDPERRGVVLWEATSRPEMASVLAAAGFTVVAVPHNLEALVPQDARPRTGLGARWQREADALANCEAVLTIAEDEAWLLRVAGVRARWLPFLPPTTEHARLDRIRAARGASPPPPSAPFLVLGTCTNPPTRLGVEALLEMIARIAPATPVRICGKGSESVRVPAQASDVQRLGRVDDETLDALRSECRALLCYQAATSGALTRVPEALAAGIPVVANVDAARSWSFLEGVHVFEDEGGLAGLLAEPLESVPEGVLAGLRPEQVLESVLRPLGVLA